jgi:hypothetical protein
VPTHAETDRFRRDSKDLTRAEREAFRKAVAKFLEDLPSGRFRKGLRIKRVQGTSGIFEMTWAADGRATFQYGEEIIEGEPHVVWRRVGTHAILSAP